MFKWLSNYLKSSKEKNEKEQYINGFDYATGKLLRGESTPQKLERHIIYMNNDPFDCGIIAAIITLKKIGFIMEDLDFIDNVYKEN